MSGGAMPSPAPCTPPCARREQAVYAFRPAFIQPLHGITSRTTAYRVFYAVLRPLLPVLKALFPAYVTTTEQLGRAMLAVAKYGAPKRVLENRGIVAATM